jgi:hypothetical protein
VRVRAPDGVWTAIDTGTIGTINAVHREPGRLLVGTSEGELRESRADGPWTVVRKLDDGDRVRDIDRVDGRWFVLASHAAPSDGFVEVTDRVTVWSGTADDLSDLVPLRRFEDDVRGVWVLRGQVARGGYYVNVHPLLWKYELASGEWRSIDAKNPVRFHVSPETGMITTVSRGVYAAEGDDGKFKRVAWNPGRPNAVWLDGMADGWGTAWINPTANTVAMVVMKKVAVRGAKSWAEVARTPTGCTLLVDSDGEPRWCTNALGTILRRDGAEWTPEFVAE